MHPASVPATPALRAICLPSTDDAFRTVVQQYLAAHPATSAGGLEAWLRPLFPSVTVRERVLSDELVTTWYVYRDGTLQPVEAGWWESPDLPRTTVDPASGRFLTVDAATAAILGRSVDELVGLPYQELIAADGRGLAAGLWEHLVRDGSVQTVIGLARPDGTTVMVEAWASLGDGVIEGRYREVGVVDLAARGD